MADNAPFYRFTVSLCQSLIPWLAETRRNTICPGHTEYYCICSLIHTQSTRHIFCFAMYTFFFEHFFHKIHMGRSFKRSQGTGTFEIGVYSGGYLRVTGHHRRRGSNVFLHGNYIHNEKEIYMI